VLAAFILVCVCGKNLTTKQTVGLQQTIMDEKERKSIWLYPNFSCMWDSKKKDKFKPCHSSNKL